MKILDKILGGNILYYPGCLTKFVGKDLKENYEKILRTIGIDFIELKEKEVCCGSPALNAGYKKTAEDLVRKNYHVFKEHRVTKIISNCPACCKTFSQDYPLLLKEWDIKVEHASQTIYKAIQEGKLKLKKKIEKIVTFHDPCYLGRYMSIYEEPRKILEFIGCKIVEMKFNRQNSFCCGGGGGVQSNYSELANSIAKERIQQALETKAEILVTACPLCYYHLKRNSQEIQVFELSQLLVQCI
jgi:heterodisulfide reductase subunit D